MNSSFPRYEIPAELREFAEKSVDQARKAFDGFLGAAHKALDTFENQALSMPLNAQETARRTLSYAESNVAAAFDLAEKLVRAKDIQEVSQYQSEYLQNQFNAFREQTHDLSAAIQKNVKASSGHTRETAKEANSAVKRDA